MITPAELERHHRKLSQAGGLESRILYVMSAPSAKVSPFAAASADLGDLADRLRKTLELSRSGVLDSTDPISRGIFALRGAGFQPSTVLPLAVAVRDGWDTLVIPRLPRAGTDDIAALRARAEVQVVRLAAAYAIGCAAEEIGLEHVAAAVAVWRYCAESAELLFSIAASQASGRADPARCRRVLDLLRKRGGWVTQTEVNRDAFGSNARAADMHAVTAHLEGQGLIESHKVLTGGGPRTEWRLMPPKPPVRKDVKSP